MAFEQNQQEAFNLRNDTESLKRLQAELDKATTSIGAAEAAAEEELAAAKLKNLAEQQKERLAQLDRLIAQEEAGIRELSTLRLKLSERQFELRKKEIQKELQLAKNAANELHKVQGQKTKNLMKKPTSSVNDVTTSVKKSSVSIAEKTSGRTTDPEMVGLVGSIDRTLGTLRDAVTTFVQSKEKGLLAGAETQTVSQSSTKDLQVVTGTAVVESHAANTNAATEATNGIPVDPGKLVEVKSEGPKEKNYTNNTNGLKEVDLGHYSFEAISIGFENLRKSLAGKDNAQTRKDLNNVINSKKPVPQGSIDVVGELLKNIEAANEAEQKLKEFNEASVLVKRLRAANEEHQLRKKHADNAQRAAKETESINAKAKDLEANRQKYIDEERQALENNFAKTRNQLAEDFIKAEEARAYTLSHEKELLEQEGQKLRNEHSIAAHRATLARIAAEAKAEDLKNNRGLYLQEAFWTRQNAFADEQNKLQLALIDAEADRDFQKNPANSSQLKDLESDKLRLAHINTEGGALKALRAAEAKAADLAQNRELYFQEEKWALEKQYVDTQNKLIEERIKTEAALAYTRANRDELIAQEELKLKNEHENATFKAMQTNIAIAAKKNDIEQNRKLYAQEEYRALSLAFLAEQNKLTEEEIQAEAKLNFVKNNEGRLLDQAAHNLRIRHINAEHDAMQNLINAQAEADDIKNNRDKYLEEELQKLKVGHANKENELNLAAIVNEAKAKDLEANRETYVLEARLARENAIAEEHNRLIEERIKAETEIAVNAANRKELLDQEEQKVRLSYLAEYQQLQADGFNHLTENMTAAEFEKLRAETAATEKAIAERNKISTASEKALATLRGKGTIAEKKQLLAAQIKERAAEKDWSDTKYKITDDMSDDEKAEIQKKRENAVKAEMAVNAAMGALANLAQQINNQTDKIGEKQAPIDTRLQGSSTNDKILGSYWKQLARDMNKIGAVNPYFTQEDFASNIETLVNKGISFDIKQRAFLMTIQEKIANTFNAADGTLLRLIRIQQQDTTAGRLGMESALNSFLNSMYETSEYLTDVASSVRGSLEEMQALMEGAAGTELEFQVQKWMGSLYSVGMSQDAVQSIAQTFGQIASGDVSGLTGSGTGNLLIMAANEAGMSIADILQDGLNADETNKLMQAMVNYLAEIAETSSDSRVVQQQLASVYGVKASDLKAATNLASSIKDVSKQDLTYSGMLGQLNKMANSMILRTSTGEMLSNVWGNVQYTMATQMANDPILYMLPRIATLLEDYAGGIDIPFINVMGFGLDLNTSVAQLMNVAAMSGSILGALGPMISGLSAAVSGSAMLSLAGINTSGKAPVIARGAPAVFQNVSGSSLSESGYIGNSSGEDVKNATLQDAEDSKKKQMVEAKEEESSDDVVMKSQLAVVSIYNLLEEVAHGSQSLRVRLVSGSGSGGNTALSCNCNHAGGQDPLGGNDVGGVTSPNNGTNGTDNGNWVLSF